MFYTTRFRRRRPKGQLSDFYRPRGYSPRPKDPGIPDDFLTRIILDVYARIGVRGR